jgi:alkanesulfonate monooxygenase SsuD/methylene tetrahydromethanopterin reductase-like flavin-dependent oxidoreductase (luciferase family)
LLTSVDVAFGDAITPVTGPDSCVHVLVVPDGAGVVDVKVVVVGTEAAHIFISEPALAVMAWLRVKTTVSRMVVQPVALKAYSNRYVPGAVRVAVVACVFVGDTDEPASSAVHVIVAPDGLLPFKPCVEVPEATQTSAPALAKGGA